MYKNKKRINPRYFPISMDERATSIPLKLTIFAVLIIAAVIPLVFFTPIKTAYAVASMKLEITGWPNIPAPNGSGTVIVTVKNEGDEILEDVELFNTTPPMPDWLVMSVSPSKIKKLMTVPMNFTLTFRTTRLVEAGTSCKVYLYAHAKDGTVSETVYLNVNTVENKTTNETTPPQPPSSPQENATSTDTTNNTNQTVLPQENITNPALNASASSDQGNATSNSSSSGRIVTTTNVTHNNQSGSTKSSKGSIEGIYILGMAAVGILILAILVLVVTTFNKRKDKETLGPHVVIHGRVDRKTDEGFVLDIGSRTFVMVHTKEKVVSHQYILVEGYYVNTPHHGNEIYASRVEPYGESILGDPFF